MIKKGMIGSAITVLQVEFVVHEFHLDMPTLKLGLD